MSNIERPIVAKFGGHSMRDAGCIRKSADIVSSDPRRRFVMVSAPKGITDLLEIASTPEGLPTDNGIFVHQEHREAALSEVSERFSLIGKELGCNEVDDWIHEVHEDVVPGNIDWSMSRGEWLMARIFASYLGATFIDATEIIRLQGRHVNPAAYDLIRKRLALESGLCVIPGFYGLNGIGEMETFPRGGSDITGAVLARGVNARIYENWTNTNGVLTANPAVVDSPRTIRELTFEEMRELGNGGTTVLQRDAILPLIDTDIPINVRNTFNPDHPGTMIVKERQKIAGEHVIGVAGEAGFMSFNIQKYGMNEEVGIGKRILDKFRIHGIPYEHYPSGRDYVSVIVRADQLHGSEFIERWLQDEIQPDRVWVQRNLGLLSVVGQGIPNHAGEVAVKLFSALEDGSISVRAISFGGSGISMVVAVDEERIADAQRVAYEEFISQV